MTKDSPLQPRVRLAIGLTGAVIAGLAAYSASATPEPKPAIQIVQAAEPGDPAPAKGRQRKPAPKVPAQAAIRAATPPVTTPPPTVVPAATTQATPAVAPDDTAQPAIAVVTEPVRHAREAKLGRCTDTVTKASSSTIDTAHAAVSTWSQKGPDAHMFQSIVALSYSNAVASKAAAVLVAAPDGAGCEATTVQVYPTTRSCGDIEGDLKRAGRTVGDFGGVQMTQEQGASRHLLLPAPGTGCVVVAVGLALNQ